MPFPINSVHRLLLEDGTSFLLLEDGTSKLVLDEAIALDDPLTGATVSTVTPSLTFVGAAPLPGSTGLPFDYFNASSLDAAKWTQFTAGSATMAYGSTGAATTFPATSSSSTDGDLNSKFSFNLTGNAAVLHIVSTTTGANNDNNFSLWASNSNTNALQFQIENGVLFAQYIVASSQTNINLGTYSLTTHAWLRIRELNGTIFWDTSSDGISWVNGATKATPITITNMYVDIGAVSFGVDTSAGTFKWNNFNVAPANLTYEVQVDPVSTFDSQSGGSPTTIDLYSESNQNATQVIALTGFNQPGLGQSITGDGNKIGSATFYLNKTGSPAGNANAKLYTHSGVFGTSSVPTGAALATSDNFDVTTLTTSLSLNTLTFSGANQITLTNGTHYVVTIEYPAGDTSNFLNAGTDTTSPTHGGNHSHNVSGWSAVSTTDLCFYVKSLTPPGTPLLDKTSDLNTGFADDIVPNADDRLLLEDGTSFLLLEDGTSRLVLNYNYPTNNYVSYTVPASTLSSGTTYYWRVRQQPTAGSYGAWSETRSFLISSGSTLTKTQTTTARIQITSTKTQSATARISAIASKTQGAAARIQTTGITKTQSATARISKSITKTQSATARVQVTATKTQTAVARIAITGTKTQSAIARVQNTAVTKTQTALARIQNTASKTQSATARIQITATKTQTAIARIAITGTKTQSGIARISATVTKTQTAIARIQGTVTKAQTAIARVAIVGTKTQTAIARISTSLTKTQSATSRITNTVTKTQNATARIQNSVTINQTAIARVGIIVTKTQTSTARISKSITKTQGTLARITATVTKTQTATARIQISATKTQTSTARISVTTTKTQTATARVMATVTKTQGAVARISITVTKVQSAVARIAIVATKTQTSTARITKVVTKTQSATASILNGVVITKTQGATARISRSFSKAQSATATIAIVRMATITATARIGQAFSPITPGDPIGSIVWVPTTNAAVTVSPGAIDGTTTWTPTGSTAVTVSPSTSDPTTTWTPTG